MQVKTSAHYQREFRRRLREQGLVKKEVWIRPEHTQQLLAYEKQLRLEDAEGAAVGGKAMASEALVWTTSSLFHALKATELVSTGRARLEFIEGAEPVLLIEMTEFGDLPLFLTVSGEQILVECLLWPMSHVQDVAAFNELVLMTHKYFPLSTISLETGEDGQASYTMFGALSRASVLNSVLIEIETLATNVLQVTEAYADYLVDDARREA
jgi:uncharacterized protein YjfI (DUF2170 family)